MAESPTSMSEVPPSDDASHMRAFLESGQDWKWPPELGHCYGDHCSFYSTARLPFIWIKNIPSKKATIDVHEVDPESKINFQGTFVVKTPRETGSIKAREVTANEVNTMKDLRYPHVTALLGTFEFRSTISILIFPAACCDLRRFMKHLSADTSHIRERPEMSHLRRLSEDTSTSDDVPRQFSSVFPPKSDLSHDSKPNDKDSFPLDLPCSERLSMLRKYFVCLSQALRYLHENDVRHKDIKPENILIDRSRNVLLTDFGISRRFEKHAPHTTNNEWKFTPKYVSPEMMVSKQSARGDPSDVFSLGCVFLEMATLLLGKSLKNLTDHYTTQINASPKREDAYYCNLDNLYTWIKLLATSTTSSVQYVHESEEQIYEDNDIQNSRSRLAEPLLSIREMLDLKPEKRPKSEKLWERFKKISLKQCKDCDPRQGESVWKPSDKQIENSQSGRAKRRSIMVEESVDESKQSAADHQYLSVKQSQGSRSPRAIPLMEGHIQKALDEEGTFARPRSPPLSAINNNPSITLMTRNRQVDNSSPYSSRSSSQPFPAFYEQGTGALYKESRIPEGERSSAASKQRSPQTLQNAAQSSQSHPPPSSPRNSEQQALAEPQADQALAQQEDRHRFSGMWFGRLSRGPSIIVYDFQSQVPYEAPFITLQGREYLVCDLPRSDRQVNIGDMTRLTAKVDLGSLGISTKFRRILGRFPKLYIINYDQTPQEFP